MTAAQLIAFTQRVADAFEAKQIPAPVHLCSDTQAEPLIEIFRGIRPQDWVFSTWRSSFHALLKGIPEDWVFAEILAGRSMYLINREHNFYSSSIVGGILPIALGVAAGLVRRGDQTAKVWVFVGDMAARTGLFHEFMNYAQGHALPIQVALEDNGLSTDTPTKEAWGQRRDGAIYSRGYPYERTRPHVGIGRRVEF